MSNTKKDTKYEKLDEYGFLPETKLIDGNIIIGTVKPTEYKDNNVVNKYHETTDKIFADEHNDYNAIKIKIRSTRNNNNGDMICSTHARQSHFTTNNDIKN